MVRVETITRKWGNSLGITIPTEITKKFHLQENQQLVIDIKPINNLVAIRGLLQTRKSSQQLKNEMREGWK